MDDASLDDFLGDDDAEGESDDAEAEGQPTADEGDDAEAEGQPTADEGDTEPEAPDGDAGAAAEADETGAGADEDDTGAGVEAADDGVAVDPETVAPAASTYAWSAEPVACAACGTAVRRRFRDAAGLVCADCKEW